MKKDYERSRREKGIEILQHWFSNLDKIILQQGSWQKDYQRKFSCQYGIVNHVLFLRRRLIESI